MFVSDAWPAAATYHRPFGEHCSQRVGRCLLPVRPVQISWRSRCLCRSIYVEDSASCRFQLTFAGVLLRPILAQHLPRNYHSFLGFNFGTLFYELCATFSERYTNLVAVIDEIQTFFGTITFPLPPILQLILVHR